MKVNGLGYELLQAKKYPKAIAVLELNADLYPAAAYVYDSLGEVYLASGKRELAIANTRKALELIPVHSNARDRVTQLTKY